MYEPQAGAAHLISTEHGAQTTGIDLYSVLRNNWYSEYLIPPLTHALASGKLIGAAGNGGAAYVTREDCARAVASALARDVPERRFYEVTGPAVVNYAELSAITERVTKKPVRYVEVPLEGYVQGLRQAGVPDGFAQALGSFQVAMREGALGIATDAVETLSGRKPTGVEEFLARSRGALGV